MYTRGHNKQSVSKHEAVQAVRAMSLRHRRRRSCEKNSTSSTVHHIHANCAADCWNPGDAVLMLLPTCESFPYSPNSTAPTSWRQVELHGCAYGTIVVSKIRTTIDPFQRRVAHTVQVQPSSCAQYACMRSMWRNLALSKHACAVCNEKEITCSFVDSFVYGNEKNDSWIKLRNSEIRLDRSFAYILLIYFSRTNIRTQYPTNTVS